MYSVRKLSSVPSSRNFLHLKLMHHFEFIFLLSWLLCLFGTLCNFLLSFAQICFLRDLESLEKVLQKCHMKTFLGKIDTVRSSLA